jgi:hypothetical protein
MHVFVCFQEKEVDHTLAQKQQDYQRIMEEKEDEMRLAIEERELQKMAALSQQDNKKDELQRELDETKMVGTWNRPLAILLAHKLKTCF